MNSNHTTQSFGRGTSTATHLMTGTAKLCHALIRTHHIRSRKKVATLKHAAQVYDVYALLRTGGSPGMMYVQAASATRVQDWIKTVQKLRYLDYQLLIRPGDVLTALENSGAPGQVDEVTTLKDFANAMEERGLLDWWRAAMGYTQT